ncbi:MAG: hypothetical protein AAFU61_02415 [Pseudomonadota bacterium]
MLGLPPWLVEYVFMALLGAGFLALTAWGIALQRLVSRLERAHPDWYWTLRRRSKRALNRLAVSAEYQTVVYQNEPIPDEVMADPVTARLVGWERKLRGLFVPVALAGFLVYAMG